MIQPLKCLGSMPVQEFLDNYWQKKPLLIRQALPDFECPVSGDELAGLALEEDIESRLVIEKGEQGPWQLECGPFAEDRFGTLPESHWTLLVQAVDLWVPEVADLLDHFRFLPSWRLDDVMFSYAPDGGSVGPHFDQYDVFLLQGNGQRRWQVGPRCGDDSPRLADTQLDILAEFEAEEEWLLEPGDILYVPAQYAHWGVAEGDDCITISVGFRAPSHAEIVGEFASDMAEQLPASVRYRDTQLSADTPTGEITAEAIAQVTDIVRQQLEKPDALAHWFGCLMTEPKYAQDAIGDIEEADWEDILSECDCLFRHPSSRLAYIRNSTNPNSATLFFDGHKQQCSTKLAQLLCENKEIEYEQFSKFLTDPEDLAALSLLLACGTLVDDPELDDEDDADDDE